MSQPFKEIPMPSQEDYFRIAQIVEASADVTNGKIRHLLLVKERKLRDGSPSERLLFAKVDTMGRKLEPRDPETTQFIDKTIPSKIALALGATAGMLIAGELHRDILYSRDVLQDVKFDPYTHDSKILRAFIYQYGNIGLDILGENTISLIDEWRQELFVDYEKRLLFSQMIGLVTLGASNTHELLNERVRKGNDIAEFEATFNRTPEEIDDELARLLEAGQ